MRRMIYVSLSAFLLALVAVTAMGQTQTQSRVATGQPEREGPAKMVHPRSTRIAAPPSAVFTRQASPLPDDAVFSASPRTSGERASIVKTQLANNNSQPFWPQWGLDPQHGLQANVAGQRLNQILAAVTYDALIADEEGQNGGNLLAHFQVPLIDGNDVYMESKDGAYSLNTYSTERWHQNKFTWQGGTLVKVWTFDTDWIAPGSTNDFWEPVYHAALANGFVYDMGAGGTLFKLNKSNGSVVKRLNPFGTTVDPNTFTASPPSVDASGNVYYNVVKIVDNTQDFFSSRGELLAGQGDTERHYHQSHLYDVAVSGDDQRRGGSGRYGTVRGSIFRHPASVAAQPECGSRDDHLRNTAGRPERGAGNRA